MTPRLSTPKIMLVTNRLTAPLPLPQLARRAIQGGVDVVQIREKDLSDADLGVLCSDVLAAVGDPSQVMVNGSPAVARSLGIGLHLPESVTGEAELRKEDFVRTSRALHSTSASDLSQFDFAIIGHVFETGGKAGRTPLGLDRLAEIVRPLRIDSIAIGGMTPERVGPVIRAGAKGIAVLSAINESREPEIVAARFKQALEKAMEETATEMIAIQLNGKPLSIPAGTTVTGYLASKGFHERLVVVELNGAILPKKSFTEMEISAGDKVEIVHFVGGG